MGELNRRDLLRTGVLGIGVAAASALSSERASAAGSHGTDDLPSGVPYTINKGKQSVTVTELGAGLRSYTVRGVELLDSYPADSYPTGSSYGQVLSPWPNRIDEGTYVFDGVEQALPWSEPANQNAIHGLTRWMNWAPVNQHGNSVTMGLRLHAQPGYPFVIELEHQYLLTDDGLTITHTVRNVGDQPVPYGVGMHPYFTVGTPAIDTSILTLPADKYFVTNARQIPTGPAVTVQGTPFDFRTARPVGTTVFDTGFAALRRNSKGYALITLASPSGRVLTVWLDRQHEFVQIYSGDTLPDPARRRRSLAIEPYTCASNAFNNGFGLRVIPPRGTFSAAWGVIPPKI